MIRAKRVYLHSACSDGLLGVEQPSYVYGNPGCDAAECLRQGTMQQLIELSHAYNYDCVSDLIGEVSNLKIVLEDLIRRSDDRIEMIRYLIHNVLDREYILVTYILALDAGKTEIVDCINRLL